MTKENQDSTARLIIGIILVLIALPLLSMGGGMMAYGNTGMIGMMYGRYGSGYSSPTITIFSIFWIVASALLLALGVYLIIDSLKKNR